MNAVQPEPEPQRSHPWYWYLQQAGWFVIGLPGLILSVLLLLAGILMLIVTVWIVVALILTALGFG